MPSFPADQCRLFQTEPFWRGHGYQLRCGRSCLNALAMAGIEVLLITTSDLDISLLVHAENEDAAYETLKKAYEL